MTSIQRPPKASFKTLDLTLRQLEARTQPGLPAKLRLLPFDGRDKRWPLIERELAVYAPGAWHGFDSCWGQDNSWMYSYQYIDWRRDEYGWVPISLGVGVEGAREARALIAVMHGEPLAVAE